MGNRFRAIRLAAVLAVASQLIGVAWATDKILLACSGTMIAPGKWGPMPAPDEVLRHRSRQRHRERWFAREFNVTKLTDEIIDFRANSGRADVFTVGESTA